MSFLPNYKDMKRDFNDLIIEKILEKQTNSYEDKNMSPQEMLELANQLKFGTYYGTINLTMSLEETINELRKNAYAKLTNR